MGRKTTRIGPFTLGAGGRYQTLADAPTIDLGDEGLLSIQCIIDGGAEGQAPTDSPAGAFQLWCAGDESAPFSRVSAADSGPMNMTALSPQANTYVNAFANFEAVPGTRCKIVYARTGGGTTARATLYVTRS